ncbi:pilin [Xanthomonas campestris]|uniref:pilin n=1 Tax=Xanthomonas campestris TaxID=339 RepID=UPI002B4B9AB8|nr:prepilin-type N-terminal cleavage/methylation domain-containing protein [Xanthomonas campestris]
MKKNHGFTLVELMIVVAIIAIVTAVALPQYHHYVSRARAAAAIAELGGYRAAIAICATERQTVAGCSAGLNGVPSLPADLTKNLIEVMSIVDGVISARTGATNLETGEHLTIVDTPVYFSSQLNWLNTGTTCDSIRGFKAGQGHCP